MTQLTCLLLNLSSNSQQPWGGVEGMLDMAAHASNPNTAEGEMGDPLALPGQPVLPNSELQSQGKILSQNTKLREINETSNIDL